MVAGLVVVVVVAGFVVVVVVAGLVVVVVVAGLVVDVVDDVVPMVTVNGDDTGLWFPAESSATAVKVWVPLASEVVVADQAPLVLATVPARMSAPSST